MADLLARDVRAARNALGFRHPMLGVHIRQVLSLLLYYSQA